MTREPVWQDDPPFAVGEPAKVEPATDWEIERYAGYSPIVQGLIARIKAEREQTIRECAEIARTATMFTGCPLECMADEVRDAVLSLLQSKDQPPLSDPVRELRNNYKCGEEYEAGLWSRRNIEAFFRDQEKET